jgi:phosphonopyruvate decarboxylase
MRRVTSDRGLLAELLVEGYDFFTGVPDSGLKGFIAEVADLPPERHVVATSEGESIALAAGAFLAGRTPCVYLQNAGLGNTINPLTSLCIPYDIKLLLVVGHRHTLPQHRVMGETDAEILRVIGWDNAIIVEGENNES